MIRQFGPFDLTAPNCARAFGFSLERGERGHQDWPVRPTIRELDEPAKLPGTSLVVRPSDTYSVIGTSL